ncbi:Transcriptional regulatory protein [Bradyrhizobium sp. STM 3843]|nr:Transcriptional regulatory protein [Bradyrhizobium sp. STM 3843]
MLDATECERARVARDRRYDGRFFIGVRTTRIYCRPVCPVRPAKAGNVGFYPSAAAAEAARALRLIDRGALDDGSVEQLAARLGIGTRHLNRLFQRHLHASPIQVAQTARVQRAKRLLDETDWPITTVALQAGFGSLRRFNAVFAAVYRRPPSEIRRARRS